MLRGRTTPQIQPWARKISTGIHWKIIENPGFLRDCGQRSNPQFRRSNSAQPEIRQEKRNHAHDFKFLVNLKMWIHDGQRSLTHLLRTPARLNRYPLITDAGGNLAQNWGAGGGGAAPPPYPPASSVAATQRPPCIPGDSAPQTPQKGVPRPFAPMVGHACCAMIMQGYGGLQKVHRDIWKAAEAYRRFRGLRKL